MARLTGLEPATPGVTGRYSNQLSYNRAVITRQRTGTWWRVARLTGLEPATPGVTGRYSNQLSYNRSLALQPCPGPLGVGRLLRAARGGVKRLSRQFSTQCPGVRPRSFPPPPGRLSARGGTAPGACGCKRMRPMFTELMALLRGEGDEAADPVRDGRLALAALMVRIARADEDFAPSEREAILRELMRRHDLSRTDAHALLQDAERAEALAPDTVRFTRSLKDAVPYEERVALIEALWRIVLADGIRDPNEDALMRQIAPLLGVADRDSALARQRAGEAHAAHEPD